MSEKKIRKSLEHLERLEASISRRRRKTAVIVSDSKGNYLRSHTSSRLEKDIIWLCDRGLTTIGGISLLKSKLEDLSRRFGKLSVYIFLGTCDLSTKEGDFIVLNQTYRNDREKVIEEFRQLTYFANEKRFDLTLLEIPVYSIKEWNRYHGDPCPEVFSRKDKHLHTSLEKINKEIRKINESNGKYSPRFSCDLECSRKPEGRDRRLYYNFSLLKDGIHPKPLLASLWLRRIARLVRQDCY